MTIPSMKTVSEKAALITQAAADVLRASLPRWQRFNRHRLEDTTYPKLVERYSGEIYSLANRNAVAVAQTPLRLFTTKPEAKRNERSKVKSIDKTQLDYLKSKAHLTQWLTKAHDDDVVEVTEHPFIVLMEEVNSGYNGFDLMQLTQVHQELIGNAYWAIIKSKTLDRPEQIWPLLSQWVTIVPSTDTGPDMVKEYRYGNQKTLAEKHKFEPDEIIHFRMPNPRDLWYGTGPLQASLLSADLNSKYDEFNHSVIDNNAVMPWALESDLPIGEESIKRLRKDINRQHRGRNRAGIFGIFEGGLKIKMLADAKDIDWRAGSRVTLEKLGRAFDIPWSLLSTEDVNKANADAGRRQWKEDGIRPRLTRNEQKLNERLIPMYGDETLFVAYDNPVPEDKEFLLKQQGLWLDKGVVTINEVRSFEGKEEVEWGNVPLVASNIVSLGEAPVANPNAPQLPAPEPPKAIKAHKALECTCSKTQPPTAELMAFEQSVGVWLGETVVTVSESVNTASIMSVNGVVDAVEWGIIADAGVRILQTDYTDVLVAGANTAVKRTSIAFSMENREAVAWARGFVGDRITVINNETRDAIRDAVANRLATNMQPHALAKEIRQHIGLNRPQSQALAAFKDKLTTEGMLSPASVDFAADEYKTRLIKQRAEMIARTESAAAYAEGEVQAYQSGGITKVDFDPADDACPICMPIISRNPFTIAESRGFIPFQTHPNCRCDWLPVIEE